MNLGRHVGAVIGSAAILLTLAAGPALAATTLTYHPRTAAPGMKVMIENACLGVTDHPASTISAAFVD